MPLTQNVPSLAFLFALVVSHAGHAVARGSECDRASFLQVVQGSSKGAGGVSRTFTEAEVLALSPSDLRTSTAWHPVSTFQGPTLKSVLEAAGVTGKFDSLYVMARNGYETVLPASDVELYQPVLSYSRDGTRLTLSTRGPLFLVYPRDKHAELTTLKGQDRFVWMVCKVEAK